MDRKSIAFALLRATLGTLLLFAGVTKLMEGPGAFSADFTERFADTWLPAALVALSGLLLPYLEVGLGSLLVLGLFTVPALIAAGLLFLVFTFGTTVLEDHEAVGRNAIYAAITFALIWLADRDRLAVDRWRSRRGAGPDG